MIVNTLSWNYPDGMNDLAGYVQRRRADLGLTQAELAARCGLERDYIAQVESRKSKLPEPENRRKLAKGLIVSHVDLLISAGQLSADEIESLGVRGVVAPDPVRAHLLDMLSRVRLINERPGYLESVLERMLRFDRDAAEPVDQVPAARNDNGMA